MRISSAHLICVGSFLLALSVQKLVDCHNHVNWGAWDAALEAANCTANYSTSLGTPSLGGSTDNDNSNASVTSPECFDKQLGFLSVAGCKYFAQVDCASRCNSTTQARALVGSATNDSFGNDEFSYCALFCRNRDNMHPPEGDARLGCAHSANASACGCALDDCSTTTTSTASSAPAQSAGDPAIGSDDPPSWCSLYCDKVADSCSVDSGVSGCAFAEARASLTGSLVNISRVLAFSVSAGRNTAASGNTPSLDGVCSDNGACKNSGHAGCNMSNVHFSNMGSEEAVVSGTVSGLLAAPINDLVPELLVDLDLGTSPTIAADSVDVAPLLNMVCLNEVGGIFTAEMSTADPFAAVESAIESYYVCDDRPKQWCENNADICTWSEERQECWRGAAMITAGMTTASATTTGFTSGPETDSLPVYVGISVGIIVFIIIVIVIAIVVTQRCSGQSKAASVRRAVTHSQVKPAPKLETDGAVMRTRTERSRALRSGREEHLLRGIETAKKKYADEEAPVAQEDPTRLESGAMEQNKKKVASKRKKKTKKKQLKKRKGRGANLDDGFSSSSSGSDGEHHTQVERNVGVEQSLGSAPGPNSRARQRSQLRAQKRAKSLSKAEESMV